MSLGKFIADMIREEEEESAIVEVRVGRISKELQDEFKANHDAHNAAHDDMKKRINEFIKSVQLEHDCDVFNDANAELWEKVYDELGLTQLERGLSYTIHKGDRVVFRKDEVEIEEKNAIEIQ